VGLCSAGGERVLPVAVEESRRRRTCLAVARRRVATPAAPSQRTLTRAPLGELPTIGFAWLLRVAVQLYNIAALPSVSDLILDKAVFAECSRSDTRQIIFLFFIYFLPSVLDLTLGKAGFAECSRSEHSVKFFLFFSSPFLEKRFYFFAECFLTFGKPPLCRVLFVDTRQINLFAECLIVTLGKVVICRVSFFDTRQTIFFHF
jgi:hypothetical protein